MEHQLCEGVAEFNDELMQDRRGFQLRNNGEVARGDHAEELSSRSFGADSLLAFEEQSSEIDVDGLHAMHRSRSQRTLSELLLEFHFEWRLFRQDITRIART